MAQRKGHILFILPEFLYNEIPVEVNDLPGENKKGQ
jgi:hypothetical protein